jgi:hypothetical protein
VEVTGRELAQAGAKDPVTVALADAGFWNTEQIQTLTGRGTRPLVAPDNRRRKTPGKARVKQQHYIEMREALDTNEGRALYKKCKSRIESVFGQVKHNRRNDRFTRRGSSRLQSRVAAGDGRPQFAQTSHPLTSARLISGAGFEPPTSRPSSTRFATSRRRRI